MRELLERLRQQPITLAPTQKNIKSRVHGLMRELGTEAGIVQPLSISGIRKSIQNFDPALSWMVTVRLENFIGLDRHVLMFLDYKRKLPSEKTRKEAAQLLEKNRLPIFYKHWVEHESHVEIVTHKSDHIEHVWNGFPIGEVITNVLEIYAGLIIENHEAEAKIVVSILDIMMAGNIPLGTYQAPAMRRTIVITQ